MMEQKNPGKRHKQCMAMKPETNKVEKIPQELRPLFAKLRLFDIVKNL